MQGERRCFQPSQQDVTLAANACAKNADSSEFVHVLGYVYVHLCKTCRVSFTVFMSTHPEVEGIVVESQATRPPDA